MLVLKTESSEKTPYYLYSHVRLDTNQPFYIGIGGRGEKDEFNKYKRAISKKDRKNPYWHNIINKTSYTIKILLHSDSWEEICEKEKEFIKLYGRKDKKEGLLCNLTDGGDGANGINRGDKYKKLHSERMKLKNPNFEGKNFLGKKHTPEAKEKMSKVRKGIRFNKTPLKNILQYDLEENFIKEWSCLTRICENLKCNSASFYYKKLNKDTFIIHKDYKWKYK